MPFCFFKNEVAACGRFLFDEKKLVINAETNLRNDSLFSYDLEDVPFGGNSKFPAEVKVRSEMSSEEDAMLP